MTASTTTRRDVLIITVQYGNFADTAELVASLCAVSEVDALEMVIVDNGARDTGETDSLGRSAPFPVHVVRPRTNLYYWGGAAHALELVRKANDQKFRWTVICNNDVLIDDRSFVRRLRALDVDRYPVVAPMIVDVVTGRDQNPLLATSPGTLKRLKWRVQDLHYGIATGMLWARDLLRRFNNGSAHTASSPESQDGEHRIYAPHGACVILSDAFFEKGGALDTTLSMYAEELSLAATAERLGLPVWHLPFLRVIHKPHSTTGASLTREKFEMERQARKHYFDLVAHQGDQTIVLTKPS